MKNPLELAEEYCIKTMGFVSKTDCGNFLAGYDAAVAIVEEELKLVEERRSTEQGTDCIYSALKSLLAKMEGKCTL